MAKSPSVNVDFPSIMLPAFKKIIHDKARYLLLKGGAGAGKSWAAAQKIVYRCLSEVTVNHKVLIVRKTNKAVKHSCYSLMKNTLESMGVPHKAILNNIKFNGNELIFTGLDDPAKIKSIEGITIIWAEEANELTWADFEQLDLRLRGEIDTYLQIILSFNPHF